MIVAAENMLKEGKDKLSDAAKGEVEGAVAEAKKHLESESIDDLKAATEKLQGVTHKVAGEMYQQEGGPQGQDLRDQELSKSQDLKQSSGGQDAGKSDKKDDDVVDADFKEV